MALGSAALAMALGLALAALIDARRARGGGRWMEAAGLMTLAASPFVIGTGLFILIYPLADPFALALPVTAVVNAAMALPFVLSALLPALTEARMVDGRLADSLGIAGLARFRLVAWARLRGRWLRRRPRRGALHGRSRIIALFAPPEVTDAAAPDAGADGGLPGAGGGRGGAGAGGADLSLFWVFDRGGRLDAGA